MKYLHRISLVAAVALTMSLGACSSPNPTLYTIAPVNGPVLAGAPRVIMLREISLAQYLERTQIVRSTESYRLTAMNNDWWGEPPGGLIGRVLVEELGQRLPGSTVYGETGAVSATPNAQIELNILRLDDNGSGMLAVQAQVGIKTQGVAAPLVHSFRFSVPVPQPTTEGTVAAISAAVGQLADGIAGLLTGAAVR